MKSEKMHLKADKGGQSLVASVPISKGEVAISERGEILKHPTMHSIQVNDTEHMNCSGQIIYACHNCDANARMVPTLEGCSLVALRDIEAGELVSFDYDTTEWDMSDPFDCLCGSPKCKGRVAGFRHLSQEARDAMPFEHMSDYVRGLHAKQAV
eukprot:CAMPEP_0174925826 /NCGR_PEP_ID=MMETSP1355-20121228/8168_1 /TAXON_ID=464990 /ORGANISM="Hemiselmis tepida, Strain CCMP443" /LENGTH=153 /DNA_ID=CAMNT_0016171785 /DNA_START=238 /DNA_END=699 /DNA_ORIENTATION=-